MMNNTIKDVQDKILDIMKYIDKICREHSITYYIMGGTALGAVRHRGFIPWDDDLDIFMTPIEYKKFRKAFYSERNDLFVLQEWRTTPDYLEYTKVRLNGTTFIEKAYKDRLDLHQGIYVDIMILHKCPQSFFLQKKLYYECKYVTLYALSQRNWIPKTKVQKSALKILKFLPNKILCKKAYEDIYSYDFRNLKEYAYFYWITPAKFKAGLFEASMFENPIDIRFEDTYLMGSRKIKRYLKYRYGDYMKMPSKEQQKAAVHAFIYDTEKDFKEYLINNLYTIQESDNGKK